MCFINDIIMFVFQEFHREIPEQQVHITTANQHGQALMEKCRPDDVPVVQAQLKGMNDRWKALRVVVMERQQKLEEALLALGQFQLALEEILAWMNHTNQTLDKELQQKHYGDVRSIEVEMSKHRVGVVFCSEFNGHFVCIKCYLGERVVYRAFKNKV